MNRSWLFLFILIFFGGVGLGFFLRSEEPTAVAPDARSESQPAKATSSPVVIPVKKERVVAPVPVTLRPVATTTPMLEIATSTAEEPISRAPVKVCRVFPKDNPWNQDISGLPVHPKSADYIERFAPAGLHADFGGNGKYGIPFNVISDPVEKVPVRFVEFPKESDAGPYPIPKDPLIENGSDGHLIVFEKTECKLYELYRAVLTPEGWTASSGAIFDLTSNALRPDYFTSADAAGLPIYPGLVKYEEVASGEIYHALRFTLSNTQKGFIHPATHYASASLDENRPPMGARFRLKKEYDLSKFHGQSRVILESLKKYGMILADNGTSWYITGARDSRWNDDDLQQLRMVKGSDMEVVYTGEIVR